jgi:penicillin-binding protein 2
MVIPRQVKNLDTLAFCSAIDITRKSFDERMKKARRYSSFSPSVFMAQITKEEYGRIAENLHQFPGFYFQTRSVRNYPYPIAAHTLGNIGEVGKRDLEKDSYYKVGDYIGKSGIESFYEKELRGEKGMKIIVVDVHNREKERFMNGDFDTLPVAGKDIYLGIDAELQAYGEALMRNRTGSIVAIEPSTGQILAMVTSPSYDPNELVGRVRGANYSKLLNDSLKPLVNRATSGIYPPGSTFKMVNGLIVLESGVVTKNSQYPCMGKESQPIRCTHSHSNPVSLYDAIENSCNPYFWETFRDMFASSRFASSKEAYQYWYELVTSFGLGSAFKTDIPSEASGNIPKAAYYDKLYRGVWNALTVRSLSIGQGEILVTPLQLANLAAAIGNEGYYYPPHLIKSFSDGTPIDSNMTTKRVINIKPKHFRDVKVGMCRVFEGESGTARYSAIDSIQVAGKTGTAENPHGNDHSLFMGFAPADNPQIAIAVVVENAGFGSQWAAPIASLMMEKYIRGYIKNKNKEKRFLE